MFPTDFLKVLKHVWLTPFRRFEPISAWIWLALSSCSFAPGKTSWDFAKRLVTGTIYCNWHRWHILPYLATYCHSELLYLVTYWLSIDVLLLLQPFAPTTLAQYGLHHEHADPRRDDCVTLCNNEDHEISTEKPRTKIQVKNGQYMTSIDILDTFRYTWIPWNNWLASI